MVLSPEADTIYRSSKSTTLTAALCPTRTLLRTMSLVLRMSHTAMVRSCGEREQCLISNKKLTYKTIIIAIQYLTFEQVTIVLLQNLRWSTASQ